MKRWLFNIAAAASMLLLLTTLALWVRSYRTSDAMARLSGGGEIAMQSARGVIVAGATNTAHRRTTYRLDHWAADFSLWPTAQRSIFNRIGFGYRSSRGVAATIQIPRNDPDVIYPPILVTRTVYLPHWFASILFAMVPGIWIYHVVQKKRRGGLNLCRVCGYDLRATPDRCPECATIPVAEL